MNLTKLLRHQWDRVVAGLCVVAGFVALLLGWQGISDHTLATEQLPYLASGAMLGLFMLGLGATVWLSADLRDTWKALRDVHNDLTQDDGADDDVVPRVESVQEPEATAAKEALAAPRANGSPRIRRVPAGR